MCVTLSTKKIEVLQGTDSIYRKTLETFSNLQHLFKQLRIE